MLPFLKIYFQFKLYIYSSLQYIIPKTKQSCKKRMEKQQHITTATLSQSFPLPVPAVKVLTRQWKV